MDFLFPHQAVVAQRVEVVAADVFRTGMVKQSRMPFFAPFFAPGNALIKQANPQMSDELLAYGVRQMNERGIVASGDARKFGLLTMTDARWLATIAFLRSVGLTKPDIDYRRAYTLDLVKAVRVVP